MSEFLLWEKTMKNKNACTLAALFLALTIGISVINYIYVQNSADQIIQAIESLPSDAENTSRAIRELQEIWETRRAFLDFTLSKPELDKISLLFDEAVISLECNNQEEYEKAMARLKRAIADIKDLEKISVENIF